ncbi:NAD(P)H-binding protein [Microlunatus panaciterrae]|uniref:Uncharacterized protein YbjT (DUF2867 family) n=1 Tax=Microlunatus panaciterrae TaxID=400768 RepID=A0ABS2RMD3_9ACTN|nr:SDR family oxidoreductase [Microlunatus panaciterrae]MBM7800169.1 uncharacterized protein YbjT (DUF2867 family) [Microlunatus panaciterrae]
MRVVVAGGHGQIARLVLQGLAEAGHQAVGLIRNPDHAVDLLQLDAIPVLIDLEQVALDALAADLVGVDAVVFAAGAGPGSGPERKLTVDRDAAVLLADAAERAGVNRYLMVSALGADSFDPDSTDVFQIYLRAKSEADADLRRRDLDWTIIRPGGLTDDQPTGLVTLAEQTGPGSIPRADVAALVIEALLHRTAVRCQFEAISGETPINEALAAQAGAGQ